MINVEKKDSINILAEMRRKKESAKTTNKMATMFVAFGYLTSFIIMIYLEVYQILAYISIFVFLLCAIVYRDYLDSKRDIESIDELYLSYQYIKNNK
jgi:hypothetical protein